MGCVSGGRSCRPFGQDGQFVQHAAQAPQGGQDVQRDTGSTFGGIGYLAAEPLTILCHRVAIEPPLGSAVQFRGALQRLCMPVGERLLLFDIGQGKVPGRLQPLDLLLDILLPAQGFAQFGLHGLFERGKERIRVCLQRSQPLTARQQLGGDLPQLLHVLHERRDMPNLVGEVRLGQHLLTDQLVHRADGLAGNGLDESPRRSFGLARPDQRLAATAKLGIELAQIVFDAVLERQDARIALAQPMVDILDLRRCNRIPPARLDEIRLHRTAARQHKVELARHFDAAALLARTGHGGLHSHHGGEWLGGLPGIGCENSDDIGVRPIRPDAEVVAHAYRVGRQRPPHFATRAQGAALVLRGVKHIDVLLAAGHDQLDRVLERGLSNSGRTRQQGGVAKGVFPGHHETPVDQDELLKLHLQAPAT